MHKISLFILDYNTTKNANHISIRLKKPCLSGKKTVGKPTGIPTENYKEDKALSFIFCNLLVEVINIVSKLF